MKITTPYQYINPQGDITTPLPAWASDERLVEFYQRYRLFDSMTKKQSPCNVPGSLAPMQPA